MRNESGTVPITAEELIKYKALLDEGAITEDEFQKIKTDFLENDGKAETQPTKTPAAEFDLKKILKFIIPAVVVFVAVIVTIVLTVRNNDPESIAEAYIVSDFVNNKKATSLYAYDYEAYLAWFRGGEDRVFEWVSGHYDCMVNSWNDCYKAWDNSMENYLVGEFGKYTIAAEAVESRSISTGEFYRFFASTIEDLEDCTTFDSDYVDEAISHFPQSAFAFFHATTT